MPPSAASSPMRSGLVALGAGALLAALAVALPAAARANPAGPHDPIGAVSSIKAASGGLSATGWAADPDALSSDITVSAMVDGHTWAVSVPTSVADASVASKYKTGPTPGFTMKVPVASGSHTVCIVARNTASGMDTVLKCVVTPLGTSLTSSQLATHDPVGAISHASATKSSLRVQGWSSDPDVVYRRATVVLYVDSAPTATVTTTTFAAPRPAAAGGRSAFDITVPASTGSHLGCIWVVNVGLGSNTFLGCKALDTRGPAGTGTVTTPKLNTEVVTEAKKHIGQAYVWGATGPKQFDCSGLVVYSYNKFGYSPPRTSEQQFGAARVIPASRAVPGDLVFTHDSEGDVYHVGIYTGPGMAVAAIDTDEGVNYQKIWDPSSTTYGSFTHT